MVVIHLPTEHKAIGLYSVCEWLPGIYTLIKSTKINPSHAEPGYVLPLQIV